jgi:dTMP kinase
MSAKIANPMFVVLEGGDGVGKSTQQRLLCGWLAGRGYEVLACRDPGSTPLGEKIRSLLLDRHGAPIDRRAEMLLYMAARAQMVEEVIRPALADGKAVVSDRFLLSNIVYQGYAGGLDIEDVRRVGQIATAGLEPALVIVLDMPPDAARGRIGRELDRMEQQDDDFRRRLREGYMVEASREPERIAVVNAAQSMDEVHAEIRAQVEKRL